MILIIELIQSLKQSEHPWTIKIPTKTTELIVVLLNGFSKSKTETLKKLLVDSYGEKKRVSISGVKFTFILSIEDSNNQTSERLFKTIDFPIEPSSINLMLSVQFMRLTWEILWKIEVMEKNDFENC